ncbi:MAG: hypothetical protein HRU03_02320 [Nanoarchaeales archaeon]|nr:hypothetical protein [Nanoarchaeales archaeon]
MDNSQIVVITGMGAVTPFGDVEGFIEGLKNGNSNFTTIRRFKLNKADKIRVAGQVDEINVEIQNESVQKSLDLIKEYTDRENLQFKYGIHTADLAYKDANLCESDEISIIVGSSGLEGKILNSDSMNFHRSALGLPNTLPSLIAKELEINGPSISVNSACLTGISALQNAMCQILSGACEKVLVGTSDFGIDKIFYGNSDERNNGTRALSKKNEMVPFGQNRDGPVLSEGAGFLVIESLESAKKRNAHIYAEIKGVSTLTEYGRHSCDITTSGYQKVIEKILKKTRISNGEIDYVNAHGTSTPLNDVTESAAIYNVFGNTTPVSSFKGTCGHTLTSSNLLEIIACCEILKTNQIFKTNLENIGTDCANLDYVMEQRGGKKINNILKLGAGFGGVYGVVILSKYEN